MLAVNVHEAVSGGAEMFCVSGGRGLAGALAVCGGWACSVLLVIVCGVLSVVPFW